MPAGHRVPLCCRREAPDESRRPDLVAFDFPKGIPSLCAIGKPVCSMQQIGKNRDDLLHLAYLGCSNCALDQRSFLPNCITHKSRISESDFFQMLLKTPLRDLPHEVLFVLGSSDEEHFECKRRDITSRQMRVPPGHGLLMRQ
jgi:hypothetical protein